MERTLILLKPDALQRGLVGELISRFEKRGLKIVGMKMLRITPELAREHYAHLTDKPFYPAIESYMTLSPVVAFVLEGPNAVAAGRQTVGATNPMEASPGTIRADFAIDIGRNLIHASDSKETAEAEVKRFFKEEELFSYELALRPFLSEERE